MDKQERKAFVLYHCTQNSVKRRTTTSTENSRRNRSCQYFLSDEVGAKHLVCKIFFLSTLGFKPRNDKIIDSAVLETNPASIISSKNKQDKKSPHKKINTDVIDEHIETFNPTISHYRRKHAPKRRYLPSDITITAMYNDFIVKNQNIKISYELYRKCVARKHISFVKVGHEECWACECFNLHKSSTCHNAESENNVCTDCQRWNVHKKRYTSAREEYSKDVNEKERLCVSADLQKVRSSRKTPSTFHK